MNRIVLSLAIIAATYVPLAASPAPARAADCQFVLGFYTIKSLIPNTVGDCLENVHYNPSTGDALQMTTGANGQGGLLVWRKADNFTAFTDGYRTWVNGPFGLQQRFNSQRFFWEANPDRLPIVPAPAPGDRCHTAGLSLGLQGVDAGAGNFVATFTFTNELTVACTFYGYVGAQMLDSQNNPLPTKVVRDGGYLVNEPGPALVTVAPGGTAIFRMHWEDVPVGNETSCPTSSKIAVIPPDEYAPLIVPLQAMACGGGDLDVSAVRPPD